MSKVYTNNYAFVSVEDTYDWGSTASSEDIVEAPGGVEGVLNSRYSSSDIHTILNGGLDYDISGADIIEDLEPSVRPVSWMDKVKSFFMSVRDTGARFINMTIEAVKKIAGVGFCLSMFLISMAGIGFTVSLRHGGIGVSFSY